jgi:CRP-like cAMP-binding protein
MAQSQQASSHNQLLSFLNPADLAAIERHLEPVPLENREMLIEADKPIQHAYFPQTGIASILADTSEGRIEVGLIGREGLVGVPIVLGLNRSPHGFLVQAEGKALRITTANLRAVNAERPAIHAVLMRYVHALMVQTASTAFSNASFTIEARLARWILMTHDRVDGDELPLTHDFLSMMLGVRRPGVTVAVQTLEGNGHIRAARGRITVLNRKKLEELADSAYGLAEAEYASAMAGA